MTIYAKYVIFVMSPVANDVGVFKLLVIDIQCKTLSQYEGVLFLIKSVSFLTHQFN